MNSGLSSKKTPSFKWPFSLSFLKIHGQHHSSDPCTMQTKLGSLRSNVFNGLPLLWSDHRRMNPDTPGLFLRACLHGGVGPQIGEVTRGGWPHLLGKSDHIKMRDFMDRRFTPPTWSPPPPCKQPLNLLPMIAGFFNWPFVLCTVFFIFIIQMTKRFWRQRHNVIENHSTVATRCQNQLIMEMIIPHTPHPEMKMMRNV